ncbi:MAG: FG-GAP repeat protein [Lysobacterales bacterium]
MRSRLLCCALILLPALAPAQVLPWRELPAPGWDRGGEDDLFGYALAADGERLLVGLPGLPTTDAPGSGAVEVYARDASGWQLQQRLLPAQNDSDEKFGVALALSGDDLVVGSWDAGFGDGRAPGSAHVYARVAGAWQLQTRLVPDEVDAFDGFGSALALAGDWLAVAAPGFDDASGVRGAVFLYQRVGSDWVLRQRIEGADATRPGGFGCAVAIAGNRLLIADCLGDGPNRVDTGRVEAYTLGADAATPTGTIHGTDVAAGDRFGYALALDDAHLLVAAEGRGSTPTDRDRVYFFEAGPAGLVQSDLRLLPGAVQSMQLAADRALLAGPICDSTSTPGRVVSCLRRFDWSGNWIEAQASLQQPEVGFNGFGWALAATASDIAVGNPFRDTSAGPSSGALSLFDPLLPSAPPGRLDLPPGLWRFAFNNAVAGDLLVASDARLGTPDQGNEGAAWVFDLAAPMPAMLARIDNPEPFAYELFAAGSAVDGDRLVLSSTKRVPGGNSVVLRTYQRVGAEFQFVDEFELFSLPQLSGILLGSGLRLAGDTLVLQGSLPTVKGFAPRIVVLRRSGASWLWEALLAPPAADEQVASNLARVGFSNGRIALLRSEQRPPPAEPRGWVVFVYQNLGAGWTLQDTLRSAPDDPPATILYDLALSADRLALASGDALDNVLRTRVHSFRFDGSDWQPMQVLDAAPGSFQFGRRLALENDLLVVESFPLAPVADNFAEPLRLYRADADAWRRAVDFLPARAPVEQGRLLDFTAPLLRDGRLFAGGRREGPGVSSHSHGVVFEFDALDPLFGDGMEW